MRLSDFNYGLPKELIAQYPPEKRDLSRMMVLHRDKGTIEHKYFKDISSYLNSGDTMIFNNSKVIPARIPCKRMTGGKAEIFILNKVRDNLYEALVRPGSKLFSGKKLLLNDGQAVAEIVEKREVGRLVRFSKGINIEKDLDKIGQIPLPPYIKRNPDARDSQRYQTVYARHKGSTASPTAGLHFTEDTLNNLKEKGIELSYITLHVSYGTFAPVKVDDVEDHKMHKERFSLTVGTQEAVIKTKAFGKRIVAVGTTTSRVLEHSADKILKNQKDRRDLNSWTSLFIYPPYQFKIVDMLLTNFHLPKSTLLMLVSAFAGKRLIMKAYREAVRERYRFFSYGDCMLII